MHGERAAFTLALEQPTVYGFQSMGRLPSKSTWKTEVSQQQQQKNPTTWNDPGVGNFWSHGLFQTVTEKYVSSAHWWSLPSQSKASQKHSCTVLCRGSYNSHSNHQPASKQYLLPICPSWPSFFYLQI